MLIGLNPARIVMGSDEPLPLVASGDTKYLLGATVFSVMILCIGCLHYCKQSIGLCQQAIVYSTDDFSTMLL